MKCGKLTAKLRDAVPVRFYENGKEIKRYKNIEIPDAIKELEYRDFRFDVPESGPITFKIFFAPGTLPETWPDARQRKALASAIGEIIGTYPSYQAAPSFAYIIGEYTLDRNGVLTGPRNSQLMLTLDQDGYRTK